MLPRPTPTFTVKCLTLRTAKQTFFQSATNSSEVVVLFICVLQLEEWGVVFLVDMSWLIFYFSEFLFFHCFWVW